MDDQVDDEPEPAPKRKARAAAGSTTPRSDSPAKVLRGAGRIGEPLSPAEARRALFHTHVALATSLGSTIQLREQQFDAQGDALADISNHLFPPARLAMRAVAPAVFIGAEIGILREIVEGIEEDQGGRRLWNWITRRRKPEPQPLYVLPEYPEQRAV